MLGSLTGCGNRPAETAKEPVQENNVSEKDTEPPASEKEIETPEMELGVPFEVNTELGTYVVTMTGVETTDWWQKQNANTDKTVVLIKYEVENIDFFSREEGVDGVCVDSQAFRVSDNNNYMLGCWDMWYSSDEIPDTVLPGYKQRAALPYAIENDTTSLEVVLYRHTGDVGKIVLNLSFLEEEIEADREKQESLVTYADLIASINELLPEMEISGITDSEDGQRNIWINIELQESIDATLFMYSMLCVKKETEMKNAGITDITVFVYNQGESVGILMSKLEDGKYVPVLNTL